MAQLVIEHVPISDLKEWGDNPRHHDVEAIRRSMERFGIRWPIIVNRNTMQVEAGHGRLKALRELGETEVPVLFVDDDDLTAKAFAIADNRTQELTQWDEAGLADVLTELEAEGELGPTAFSIDDLNELLRKLGRFEGEEFNVEAAMEAAPDQVANTKRGEVWQLGRHRLMCGDSMIESDVGKLMDGVGERNLLTDPPYGIDAANMQMGIGKRAFLRKGQWDGQRVEIAAIVHASRMAIIWGGNYYADMLPVTADWLCWDKKNVGRSYSEFELAWSNTGHRARIVAHHWSSEEKQHITQKPLPVIVWCMRFLPKELPVHDPFLGSGTTMIAAEQVGRTCYGMEIVPHYCDVAIARWEAFTGSQAVLVEEREMAYA